MRCQRCGFEMEEGQTFCSMCGTEQTRALRKKKKSPKSILWLIRVVSKSHFKMWLVFITTIILAILSIIFIRDSLPFLITTISLNILLIAYELFYVLLGYKNPTTTKTKSYKLRYRSFLAATILLFCFSMLLDFNKITMFLHNLITSLR